MGSPYHSSLHSASNAPRFHYAPMQTSFQQYMMPPAQFPPTQQQQYPMMMLSAPMHQQQLPVHLQPCFPMYHPTHNLLPIRQPFIPINQFPMLPSTQPAPQQFYAAPPSATPTTSRTVMRNTSLNNSLLAGSTSFNDSIRYNPLGARGRSRDHSLLTDQTTSSSDRSFQQPFVDSNQLAANNDLINYCIAELCRKQLTEQELVAKVSKSRRFKKWGARNIPAAIAIILTTFPCFISRTVILKMSPNDLQPVTKTLWKSEKRFLRSRGGKLNATMSEIPERASAGGGVLSVLGDIASLHLDENRPPTTVASMEKVLEGIKVYGS